MASPKHIATLLVMLTPMVPLVAAAQEANCREMFQVPGMETTLSVYGHVEVDGTYDFHAVAYPVFKRLRVPVTLYVSTYYVFDRRPVFRPRDQLQEPVQRHREEQKGEETNKKRQD